MSTAASRRRFIPQRGDDETIIVGSDYLNNYINLQILPGKNILSPKASSTPRITNNAKRQISGQPIPLRQLSLKASRKSANLRSDDDETLSEPQSWPVDNGIVSKKSHQDRNENYPNCHPNRKDENISKSEPRRNFKVPPPSTEGRKHDKEDKNERDLFYSKSVSKKSRSCAEDLMDNDDGEVNNLNLGACVETMDNVAAPQKQNGSASDASNNGAVSFTAINNLQYPADETEQLKSLYIQLHTICQAIQSIEDRAKCSISNLSIKEERPDRIEPNSQVLEENMSDTQVVDKNCADTEGPNVTKQKTQRPKMKPQRRRNSRIQDNVSASDSVSEYEGQKDFAAKIKQKRKKSTNKPNTAEQSLDGSFIPNPSKGICPNVGKKMLPKKPLKNKCLIFQEDESVSGYVASKISRKETNSRPVEPDEKGRRERRIRGIAPSSDDDYENVTPPSKKNTRPRNDRLLNLLEESASKPFVFSSKQKPRIVEEDDNVTNENTAEDPPQGSGTVQKSVKRKRKRNRVYVTSPWERKKAMARIMKMKMSNTQVVDRNCPDTEGPNVTKQKTQRPNMKPQRRRSRIQDNVSASDSVSEYEGPNDFAAKIQQKCKKPTNKPNTAEENLDGCFIPNPSKGICLKVAKKMLPKKTLKNNCLIFQEDESVFIDEHEEQRYVASKISRKETNSRPVEPDEKGRRKRKIRVIAPLSDDDYENVAPPSKKNTRPRNDRLLNIFEEYGSSSKQQPRIVEEDDNVTNENTAEDPPQGSGTVQKSVKRKRKRVYVTPPWERMKAKARMKINMSDTQVVDRNCPDTEGPNVTKQKHSGQK